MDTDTRMDMEMLTIRTLFGGSRRKMRGPSLYEGHLYRFSMDLIINRKLQPSSHGSQLLHRINQYNMAIYRPLLLALPSEDRKAVLNLVLARIPSAPFPLPACLTASSPSESMPAVSDPALPPVPLPAQGNLAGSHVNHPDAIPLPPALLSSELPVCVCFVPSGLRPRPTIASP